MEYPSLGAWMRHRRELCDLTQEALAEAVGCAVQTIRALEHSWRRPSRSMAERLADVLAVPPEERTAFIQVARTPLVRPASIPEPSPAPTDPADYLARLAHEAPGHLFGPGQQMYLAQLDAEMEQIRGALMWALGDASADRARRVELALRAASGIERFWHARGHQSEGQRWLERGLDLVECERLNVSLATQAAALGSAGWLAKLCGNRVQALALLHRCVALQRSTNNKPGLADALDTLGDLSLFEGDAMAATWFYEESLELRRGLGRPELVALSLGGVGHAAVLRGYYERAADHFLESLNILHTLDDRRSTAMSLHGLGLARLRQGMLDAAGTHLGEALTLFHSLGNTLDVALCLDLLGELQVLRVLMGNVGATLELLDAAAQLWGAAEGLLDAVSFQLSPPELARRNGLIAAARLRAGSDRFQMRWAAGRSLDQDHAVAIGQVLGAPQ